jgi:hypothetical protein
MSGPTRWSEPFLYLLEAAMNDRLTSPIGRRSALGLAAIGVAAAAVGVAARERQAEAAEKTEHAERPRYRVTANVEAFYRVNRYPAK